MVGLYIGVVGMTMVGNGYVYDRNIVMIMKYELRQDGLSIGGGTAAS